MGVEPIRAGGGTMPGMQGQPARLNAAAAAIAATLAVGLPMAVGDGLAGPEGRFAPAVRSLHQAIRPARPAHPQTQGVQFVLILSPHESLRPVRLAQPMPPVPAGSPVHLLLDRESLIALPPPVL